MKHWIRNMRYGLMVSLICLLSGCSDAGPNPVDYTCNAEQLVLVERETAICNNTSYFSSYCFAVAKATHCIKIEQPAK